MDKVFKEMQDKGLVTIEYPKYQFLKWQVVSPAQQVAWTCWDGNFAQVNKLRLQHIALPQGLTEYSKN